MTISMFLPQMIKDAQEDAQRPEVVTAQEKLGENVLNTASGVAVGAMTGSAAGATIGQAVASEITPHLTSPLKRFAFAAGNGLSLGLLATIARINAGEPKK